MNKYVAYLTVFVWYLALLASFYTDYAMHHIISTVGMILLPALIFVYMRYILTDSTDYRLRSKGQLVFAGVCLILSAVITWWNPSSSSVITALLGSDAAWPLRTIALFLCIEAGNMVGYAVAELALAKQVIE